MEGEELIALSQIKNLKLMVGFNRRFAPMYNQAKDSADNILSVNLCKHSLNSIPSTDFSDTFIDDYIHVIDTALWLCDGDVEITGEDLILTDSNNLVFVGHKLKGNKFSVNTSMSRNAGTKLEQLEVLSCGKIQRVKNLNLLETEIDGSLTTTSSGPWTSILKQKGFKDCINHFIDSITNDTTSIISGEECLNAQRLLEKIITSNTNNNIS